MNNYTEIAISRQIKAMQTNFFCIGVKNFNTSNMIIRDRLTEDNVKHITKWLKYKNMNNYNIYIKPSDETDRALILLDDINDDTVRRLKSRGLAPACVIETSPGNLQAWVSFGSDPMPSQQRSTLSRVLAKEFGADPASVGSSHYGRLSGFTNRKEEHRGEDGLHPYVICREAAGCHVPDSKKIRDWVAAKTNLIDTGNISIQNTTLNCKSNVILTIKPAENSIFIRYFNYYMMNIKRPTDRLDLSKSDFAIVCRMLKDGFSYEKIFQEFKLHSINLLERKGKYVDDYINRTIYAASKRCGSKRKPLALETVADSEEPPPS
jgi:hypothetical protein